VTAFDTLTTTLDRATGVLTVRISNPPTDLLNAKVLADLDRLTRRLSRDRSVRSVVLTGPRDGVFVPHYDLSEIAAGAEELGLTTPYPAARAALTAVAWLGRVPLANHALAHTPARGLVELLRTTATLDRIGNLPQVVIAAIEGDALGGGCEVALACDVRVMGDGDYRIGLPELTAGIPPGAGGSVRLTRMLGAARASEMILRSITLTPRQAHEVGLVGELVGVGEALARAQRMAADLADRNRTAILAAKRTIRTGSALVESAGFVASASSPEAVARLRTFAAGADPSRGRTPWRDRSWLP